MAPMWVTGWGGGLTCVYKVTVRLLLEEMHRWILTKLGRSHPQGLGSHRCMVHVATMVAQGEGPKGQNFANFKLLQIQLK